MTFHPSAGRHSCRRGRNPGGGLLEKTPRLPHCGSALLVATDEGIPRALRQLPCPSTVSHSSVKPPPKGGVQRESGELRPR